MTFSSSTSRLTRETTLPHGFYEKASTSCDISSPDIPKRNITEISDCSHKLLCEDYKSKESVDCSEEQFVESSVLWISDSNQDGNVPKNVAEIPHDGRISIPTRQRQVNKSTKTRSRLFEVESRSIGNDGDLNASRSKFRKRSFTNSYSHEEESISASTTHYWSSQETTMQDRFANSGSRTSVVTSSQESIYNGPVHSSNTQIHLFSATASSIPASKGNTALQATTQKSLFSAVMQQASEQKTPTKSIETTKCFEPSPGGANLLNFLNNNLNSPFRLENEHDKHRMYRYQSPQKDLSNKATELKAPSNELQENKSCFMTPVRNVTSTRNQTPVDTSTPREEVDWHECHLGLKNLNGRKIIDDDCIGIIDWSIKSKVHIQCQPSISLISGVNDINSPPVQMKALQHFSTNHGDSCDSSYSLPVQFHSALFYWQHPANLKKPCLPTHTDKPADLGRQQSTFSQASSKSDTNTSLLIRPQHKNPRSFLRSSTFSVLGTKDVEPEANAFTDHQEKDWKQAFRSIYMNWIEKIHYLQSIVNSRCNENEYHRKSFARMVVDTYFYVIRNHASTSCEHTIVFRIGTEPLNNDDNGKLHALNDVTHARRKLRLIPEIVMSSSTKSIRKQLRSKGIQLRLLERWDCAHDIKVDTNQSFYFTKAQEAKVFGASTPSPKPTIKTDNHPYTSSTNNPERTNPKSVTSPDNVQSELVALRHAQLLGRTVGADVSISTKQERLDQSLLMRQGQPYYAPPLVIGGFDDCSLFCEIYLNTCGRFNEMSQSARNIANLFINHHDDCLPIILCRKLGPFLHACLKSVNISVNTTKTFSSSSLPQNLQHIEGPESLILQGYVLPCTVRDLTRIAVQSLLDDRFQETLKQQTKDPYTKIIETRDKTNVIGADSHVGSSDSHHFVLKACLYEPSYSSLSHRASFNQEGTKASKSSIMGCSTSCCLNGGQNVSFVKRVLEEQRYMNSFKNAIKTINDFENVYDENEEYKQTSCSSCHAEENLKMIVWDIVQPTALAFKLDHLDRNSFASMKMDFND